MPGSGPAREHVSAVQHLWYGHGHAPHKRDYEFSWKAVKVVASGDGELSETERLHLLGKMCAILTPADVVELVMEFDEHLESPERLLAGMNVPSAVRRGTGAWIVYEALSVAMADGELAEGELKFIHRAAATMDVPPATVDALAQQCRAEAAVREDRIRLLYSTTATESRFGDDSGEHPAHRTTVPPVRR